MNRIRETKQEWQTLKRIQLKLQHNQIVITKADKGNTIVILYKDDYDQKIKEFLATNNFTKLTKDITNKLQTKTRKEISTCNNIIKKYINMNPSAPSIYGTIKLHKQGKPIRPIVNWRECPAYKISKHLNILIHEALQLPYTFNVKNSTTLIHNLTENNLNETFKLCSFDIANMYTNIPTTEVRKIIDDILNGNNIKEEKKKEILNILDIVLEQNYVRYNEQCYTQEEGLAKGAPTSAILAEVFLQYLEHTQIADILKKHHIIDYHRYVDDILIMYNPQKTNISNTLEEFNAIHHKLNFMMEQQSHNKLNYLDLTITVLHNKLTFEIYRKPTSMDLILHNTSCHPNEHKKSAINYLYNRVNTYGLTNENKHKEEEIIAHILENNQYPLHIIYNKQTPSNSNTPQNRKWITFTYFGSCTRMISKIFRNTNMKVAFRTNNTLKQHLKIKEKTMDKYNQSGVYQMACQD
jgi:hypothetical protein